MSILPLDFLNSGFSAPNFAFGGGAIAPYFPYLPLPRRDWMCASTIEC